MLRLNPAARANAEHPLRSRRTAQNTAKSSRCSRNATNPRNSLRHNVLWVASQNSCCAFFGSRYPYARARTGGRAPPRSGGTQICIQMRMRVRIHAQCCVQMRSHRLRFVRHHKRQHERAQSTWRGKALALAKRAHAARLRLRLHTNVRTKPRAARLASPHWRVTVAIRCPPEARTRSHRFAANSRSDTHLAFSRQCDRPKGA